MADRRRSGPGIRTQPTDTPLGPTIDAANQPPEGLESQWKYPDHSLDPFNRILGSGLWSGKDRGRALELIPERGQPACNLSDPLANCDYASFKGHRWRRIT